MQTLPFLLLLLAVTTSCLGVLGIAWCRSDWQPTRARWGRRLFLGTLALLSGVGLMLALQPSRGLLYLGLVIGGLVIAMLWEGPKDLDTARGFASVNR